MRLIGLTGGIATGKSSVGALLGGLGAAVIDADQAAQEVVVPGAPAMDRIVEEFGTAFRLADGSLDREAMATLIFSDEAARLRLEAITHPPIRELMTSRITRALAGDAPLVIANIPLLYERARDIALEGVLLVDCATDIQLERLMERERIDAEAARKRIAAQMTMDEKRKRATWIIENNGDRARLAQHVERWWRDVVAAPVGE